MLPTFQVRGLRQCSADAIPGAEEGWADVQLDNEFQYEQLTREHPETTLSYVDDDDGEIITVSNTFYWFYFILPIAVSAVVYTSLFIYLPNQTPSRLLGQKPPSNSSTIPGWLFRRTFFTRRGVTSAYTSNLRPLHLSFTSAT